MTQPTVTDADREAAANILDEISSLICDDGICQVADLIRAGEYDEHHTVQMVVRHRLLGQRQGIEAKGWQDIATAPRDGEPVLLYKPDERMVGPYMLAGYWGEWPGQVDTWIACNGTPMGYWSSVTESDQGYPTHWMPLPAAPEAVGQ